jgi:hypothetical protein
MVETYDPAKQAVLTVTVGGGNPISMKVRLERAFVGEPARGVH